MVVVIEFETAHLSVSILDGQRLPIDVAGAVPRHFDDPIQGSGLEPEVEDPTRRAIGVAIQPGARLAVLRPAVHVPDAVILVHFGPEAKTQFILSLGGSSPTRVFDHRIEVRIASGGHRHIVSPRSQFHADVGIRAEVIVVPGDQLAVVTGQCAISVTDFDLAVQRQHRVQQTGIRKPLGECLQSQQPGLRLERVLVLQVQRETVQINVLAVRAVDELGVHDVADTRKDGLGQNRVDAENLFPARIMGAPEFRLHQRRFQRRRAQETADTAHLLIFCPEGHHVGQRQVVHALHSQQIAGTNHRTDEPIGAELVAPSPVAVNDQHRVLELRVGTHTKVCRGLVDHRRVVQTQGVHIA